MNGDLRALVIADLHSPDSDARAEFFKHFDAQATSFAAHTAIALDRWAVFHNSVAEDDIRRRPIVAILFTAINLHSSSFKLFMSGHTVAAGCLFRQVLEGIATAVLCATKELPVLDRFLEDRYSTKNAVIDLVRQCEIAKVSPDGVGVLNDAYHFYHKFAHLTKLTIATGVNFDQGGFPNIGAFFDPAKLPEYRKEVAGRLSLASVFPSLIDAVTRNVGEWPARAAANPPQA